MWAKTGPNDSWHGLLFHLLDVAAVARILLDRHVPITVRRRFAKRMGLPSEHAFDAWVVFLAALHDYGKATPPFQRKFAPQQQKLARCGLEFPHPPSNTPHGRMTASPELRQRLVLLGWSNALALQAVRWVGGHHGVFPTNNQFIAADDDIGLHGWVLAREELFERVLKVLGPLQAPQSDEVLADVGLFVAGLTSVADWVGSMSEHFPFETEELEEEAYWKTAQRHADEALAAVGWRTWTQGAARSFNDLFGFHPRPLQTALVELVGVAKEQFFAVVEAPMGEGKTEAALWVAHEMGRVASHRGFYLALPTMATANQMFNRSTRFLEKSYEGDLGIQLLHRGAQFVDNFSRLRGVVDDEKRQNLNDASGCGTVIAEEWFSKPKRGLLAPFAVGTIDQALLGVMRTRHGFVRLFGLSGKTVVLDEVHAYDAYTSRILDRLIGWLHQLGASVVVLSATLPRRRRAELCQQWAGAPTAPKKYPRITSVADGKTAGRELPAGQSRSVELNHIEGDLEGAIHWLALQTKEGGCAGLIVNTVQRAQDAYLLAKRSYPGAEVLLLHARFFARDRSNKEKALLSSLGKETANRPHRLLVIGTQVLEQSLDIDFDVLATDLAPVDLVLQRTGRLHRHKRTRPSHLHVPKLGIIRAEQDGEEQGPSFGVHEFIYEEAVLLRSWLSLRGRTSLVLPDQIEPLIEAVYGDEGLDVPSAISSRLKVLDQKLAADIQETELNAETRLLASPEFCEDDPFSDFGLPLDEEDPNIAKALQAVTRLGEPSVQVAFLHQASQLASPTDHTATRAILERTLTISNKGVVFGLDETHSPQAWQNSPWLRNVRAVVLDQGSAHVGNKTLIDDPDLGLVIKNS